MDAQDEAIDHFLANVPNLGGDTLVALDSSRSMVGRPQTIGSLFAAALVEATDSDQMLFSDNARYDSLNRRGTTLTEAHSVPFISRGTSFNVIIRRANRAYGRIVILTSYHLKRHGM
jgi:60 kDa SS-A/Ro ribonucleoprotein